MGLKNKRRREDNALPPVRKAILEAVQSDRWAKLLVEVPDKDVMGLLGSFGFKEPPRDGKPESWWRGLLGKGRKPEDRRRRVVILVEP